MTEKYTMAEIYMSREQVTDDPFGPPYKEGNYFGLLFDEINMGHLFPVGENKLETCEDRGRRIGKSINQEGVTNVVIRNGKSITARGVNDRIPVPGKDLAAFRKGLEETLNQEAREKLQIE
jgi:hypothetical protein